MKKTITLFLFIIPFLAFAQWEFNSGTAEGWSVAYGATPTPGTLVTSSGTSISFVNVTGNSSASRNPIFSNTNSTIDFTGTNNAIQVSLKNATGADGLEVKVSNGSTTATSFLVISTFSSSYVTYSFPLSITGTLTSITLTFKTASNTNYYPGGTSPTSVGLSQEIDYIRPVLYIPPTRNSFLFNTAADVEGFTALTRASAVQAIESSNGTLKINLTTLNGSDAKIGLSAAFFKVDGTTNKYAHISVKNASNNNRFVLIGSNGNNFPRQTFTTSDGVYKTYDFDLTSWSGNQQPELTFGVQATWSGTATYAINERVIFQNSTYKNNTGTNTTTSPITDTANWILEGSVGELLDRIGFIFVDSIVFDNVPPIIISNGTGGGSWSTRTTWAGGIVPETNDNVNIVGSDAVNSTGTRNCNQLSIASGSSLTVAGGSLTVKNGIINNGALTIDNNANLVQTAALNTNSGSGTAIVKRSSSTLFRSDYTLWSSPVASQNLLAFSPATTPTRFYNYNTATNQYNAEETPGATPFTVGKGYLIRMPNTYLLEGYDAGTMGLKYPGVFTGVPNNGEINVPITAGATGLRYNLVGNPYPSPITMSTFVSENALNIESTLYFWRKTNGVPNTNGSAYCTWNAGTYTGNGNAQSFDPTGVIQTGQGFFVEAKSGATSLTFNNTQRVSNTANQFFRTNLVAEPSKIWLNATNAAGNFSQIAVTYFDGATIGVDAFDAKYINDSGYALTSSINDAEYTIQGRPAFDVSDVVALNFKTTVAGNYTIAIDHVEGLFSTGQAVFLKDNLLNTVTDLSAGSYSFASAIGTFNSRFEVVYQSTLAVTNPTFTANSVIAFGENGEISINSGNTIMELVRVYDLQGRLLVEKKQINASETTITTTASNQVLLVEITATNGSKITKKIIQ